MNQRPAKSLRQLLIGQFLIVVAAAGTVAFLLVVFWRLPMVRQQAQTEQARALTMSIAEIDVVLNSIEAMGQTLGKLLVDNRGASDANKFAQLITHLAGHTGLIGASYLLDSNSRVLAMAWPSAIKINSDAVAGSDMGRSPGVQEAWQSRNPVWSDQYRSVLQEKPVVALVLPLDQQVLVLELSVDQLVNLIKKSGSVDNLLLMVTDRHGEVIAAADPKYYLTRRNLSSISVVRAAMDRHQVFGTFDIDQIAYSGSAQRMERMGWVVLAAYPQSITDEARHAAIGIATATLLIALTSGIALFGALSTRFQRQLQRSLDYADRVAQGDYTHIERHSDTTEINALNNRLQSMARQIQSREMQLKAIVEASPNVAIQWFDLEGRVVDWNAASESLMGWSKSQAMGKTLADLIYTPVQQQHFISILQGIDESGRPFGPYEADITNRTGEPISILSTTFAIPGDEEDRRFVCMDVDITAIKRNERALRQSEQRFNLLFNASPVAVAVIERQPKGDVCTAVNQAFVELTGRDPGDRLPQEIVQSGLFDDADSLQAKLQLLGPETEQVRLEGNIQLPDGRTRRIEGTAGWVKNTPCDLLIVAAHDVTRQQQLQDQLKAINNDLEQRVKQRTEKLSQANSELEATLQALQRAQSHLVHSEKLAALGSLVAGVAHELNTPIGNGLMVVSTLSQRLKDLQDRLTAGLRRSDLDVFLEQVQTTSDIATRNLTKASELINGFKRVAVDQTSEQRRQFDISEVVHEVLLTLQPGMKHKPIEILIDVPSVTLDSYPGPLGQVVSNLVQNAVVHAFDHQPAGVISIKASVRGDQLELTISDNGSGINELDANHIFDPFFTTKLGQGGSGLGLHIVHNIVFGMLGGEIKLHRRDSPGACFVICIPLSAPLSDSQGTPSAFSI